MVQFLHAIRRNKLQAIYCVCDLLHRLNTKLRAIVVVVVVKVLFVFAYILYQKIDNYIVNISKYSKHKKAGGAGSPLDFEVPTL